MGDRYPYANSRDAGRNWRDRELGGARGGATHLARIHGTEEDKVNCPFFFKIGACRHGDRCSRQHHKPPFSQTMILLHMYQNPASQIAAAGGDPSQLDPKKVQEEFDNFYEEVYDELGKFGEIEELNVCENLGDHMVGNVYAKFADEECTDDALKGLFGRFYAGRPLVCEFSPVTDFREARCRQYDEAVCTRGGYCNFMHIRTPSRSLKRDLDRKWSKHWKKETDKKEAQDRGEDLPADNDAPDDDDRDRSPPRPKKHHAEDAFTSTGPERPLPVVGEEGRSAPPVGGPSGYSDDRRGRRDRSRSREPDRRSRHDQPRDRRDYDDRRSQRSYDDRRDHRDRPSSRDYSRTDDRPPPRI